MKYDLVFEGGGAKGMVLVGAYEEFVRRGHSHGRLLGTSAGAITAALAAVGYTPDEMLAALDERENEQPVFAGFLGQPAPFEQEEIRASAIRTLLRNIDFKFIPRFVEERLDDAIAGILAENRRSRHLFAFVERGGWYAADRFVTWLETRLDSGPWHGGQRQFSQMTLSQFFDATQVDLSLVASDTTDGHLLVLNHNTAPQCPLVWAVRMSMSIPLLWDEVIWQKDWGAYLGRELTDHAIVDGGLLSNFPLELFISDAPHVTQLMGPKQDTPVLGMLIDESLPVPPLADDRGLFVNITVKPAELRTVQRIRRLIDTATTPHDKMVIDAFSHLVVRLPAQGYGTTEFDMSDERRAALVEAGRSAMAEYFDFPPMPAVSGDERSLEDIDSARAMETADRIATHLLEQEARTPMTTTATAPIYHVLLIGIDRYPQGYRSLNGCVNDIDAIEQLLLTPPGVGIPASQVRITRLAAPNNGRPSRSQLLGQTLAPTKANLVRALQELAGPIVNPMDRVLIYYSGHGDEKLLTGRAVWREALVPHNNQNIEYLFDVEINALINAVAARTSDLTIVLDCCHSAGAIRDMDDVDVLGDIRTLDSNDAPVDLPNLVALGLDDSADDRALGVNLLQSPTSNYLVVSACQPHEKAAEGAYPLNQPAHGVFTHSLLRVLEAKDVAQRAKLRWAEIWPELLAKVAERNTALRRRPQHPWMIGDSARHVFGGKWEPMDVGYRIAKQADDTYEISAGTLMGITEGAEFAIYGSEPLKFPEIGDPEDKPIGHLKITKSEAARAVAAPMNGAFALPDGARSRLVKPGESERLRVSLISEDATLKAQLEQSPLLVILPPGTPDAEVEVVARADGGWNIGNDMDRVLATVPAEEIEALRAGLEHYYRYNTVLRMAKRCNDAQLSNSLSVRVLDCNDASALQALSPEGLADPNLPEGDQHLPLPTERDPAQLQRGRPRRVSERCSGARKGSARHVVGQQAGRTI